MSIFLSDEILLEKINYEWIKAEKNINNLKSARNLLQKDSISKFNFNSL